MASSQNFSSTRESGATGGKILVVDDEADIAALIRRAFERYGYRFDIFTDPLSALEAFRRSPRDYALVVTDLRMPGMNGMQLAEALWQIRQDTKVLFMTAYLSEELRPTSGWSMYKKDVVEKPFNLQQFCAEIRSRMLSA